MIKEQTEQENIPEIKAFLIEYSQLKFPLKHGQQWKLHHCKSNGKEHKKRKRVLKHCCVLYDYA